MEEIFNVLLTSLKSEDGYIPPDHRVMLSLLTLLVGVDNVLADMPSATDAKRHELVILKALLGSVLDIMRCGKCAPIDESFPFFVNTLLEIGERLPIYYSTADNTGSVVTKEYGVSSVMSIQDVLHRQQSSKMRSTRQKDASQEFIACIKNRAIRMLQQHTWSANRIKNELMKQDDVATSGYSDLTVYSWVRAALHSGT